MDDGTGYYDYYDGESYYYDDSQEGHPFVNFNVTPTKDEDYLEIFVSPSSELPNISIHDLVAGASRLAQAALLTPEYDVRYHLVTYDFFFKFFVLGKCRAFIATGSL